MTRERKTSHPEHVIQCQCVQWHRLQYPRRIMFSVPNGARVDIRKAKRLVKEGLTAGVPDIFIPEPSRGFHGLFIEFKSKMGRVSDKQKLLQGILIMRGYKVEVCWSFEDFQRVVKAYY